jgi:lysophospholipase-2
MAVVFMHGLGDTPSGWRHLEPTVSATLKQQGRSPAEPLRFVLPGAPVAAVTINGGAKCTSWFDIQDWPIDAEARDDRDGLLASVKRVHAHLDALVEGGTKAERIVVGGFSQGGAIALLATYSYPAKLGGCVCLSGWLTLRDDFVKEILVEANAKTPCFWGHGTRDGVSIGVVLQVEEGGLLRSVERGGTKCGS